jgi:hypothetical protein
VPDVVADCHAAAVFTDSSELSATIEPMRPISLRRRPPRDPRARLAGLMLLPRTIDKARAALRGGDLGEYYLTPGLSALLLGEAGMTEAEFMELVQRAADETEVANAFAERIAPERCERWNDELKQRRVADLAAEDRERFLQLHYAHDDELVIDVLVGDDRRAFPPDRVRGLRAPLTLAVQRGGDDGAQPDGGVANLVGRDDERRNEAQRVAPGGVDEQPVIEPALDEVGGRVPVAHGQPEHEAEAARLVEDLRMLGRYRY